ncbi:hypothetical protein PG985_005616 [Apiospora marii]|uniref:Uncharacterized protein n=1 Tax=Apiospora marii TaxID=335849 RepID=A0ABR1RKF1_9PEZI
MANYDNIWKKRWFIPVWTVQLAIALLYVVGSIQILSSLAEAARQGHVPKNAAARRGWAVYLLLLGVGTVLTDATECVLFVRRALSPLLVLALGAARVLFGLVYFARSAHGAAEGVDMIGGLIDTVIVLVFLLAAAVQLVLGACFTFRWHRGMRLYDAGAATSAGSKNPQDLEDYPHDRS